MDLGAIKLDVAEVMRALGWQSYEYVPDDTNLLPAAVVSMPYGIEYGYTQGDFVKFQLPLDLYVSLVAPKDGQDRLNLALSTRNPESARDALVSKTGAAWRSVNVTGADIPRLVLIGNQRALAVTVTLEIVG